jgi:phage-related protein
MYKVYFYEQKNGKSPIREFILASQKPLRSKITKQIKAMQEFGLTEDNPYLRKLTGTPLWESRILGKGSTRIICVAWIERKIVVLNIFRKTSIKTPIKEITLSMKRYRDLTIDI